MNARIAEILEKWFGGSKYVACVYDADIDISGPKQFSITTGAKKAHLTIRIKAHTVATIAFNSGLVIGTGGSASAGTAVTFTKRDLADTSTPVTVLKKDYILGSSGQSAGTEKYSEYQIPDGETVIKLKLAASTAYGLVFTTVADDNYGNFIFELDEY